MDSRLFQALLDKKIITSEQAAQAQDAATKDKKDVEQVLLDSGVVAEKDIVIVKGELYDVPFIDLERSDIPREVLTIIPQQVAENYGIVVFEKQESNVKVALTNPGDYRALEALEFWAKREGYTLSKYITTAEGYRDAMKNYTAFQSEVTQAVEQIEERKVVEREERKKKRANISETIRKAPVAKIVTLIVEEAVGVGTSDIHIEPSEKETRVRFRVDGVMRTYLALPAHMHSAIVARIKVLANLKIDETRIPQDGRIRIEVFGEEINLRVSTLPMMANEKVVMRILPTTTKIITLEDLGFWGNVLEVLKKIIARPTGVLLISGPTGSGKSTTLYSMLTALNTEKVNITTLEDPIEYATPGLNQVQINTEVGLTFASGLRAILRQDPNIVMVGEIRDRETAELAIHTALTGHFMLSTIHAKDALGVIPRLVDMHVEPFLIGAALNTITAQRLVRKLCQKCKAPTETPEYLKAEVDGEIATMPDQEFVKQIMPPGTQPQFFRPVGCDDCDKSGYKGRTVVVEAISMSNELQEILNTRVNIDVLQKERNRQKLLSMKQDTIVKAMRGETSLEELLRVTRE
ncbi:type II/IV secretion system protein [Candidatus Uhrbacteria bacterium]|nr:type II/IV secretion system protein [Candidatus Uhrbacteria bacterium]